MTMQANARGSGQDASRAWHALREVLALVDAPASLTSEESVSFPSRLTAIERSLRKKTGYPKIATATHVLIDGLRKWMEATSFIQERQAQLRTSQNVYESFQSSATSIRSQRKKAGLKRTCEKAALRVHRAQTRRAEIMRQLKAAAAYVRSECGAAEITEDIFTRAEPVLPDPSRLRAFNQSIQIGRLKVTAPALLLFFGLSHYVIDRG